ncbi:MAG TPA: elongation factor G, partial [Gemmatimonadetes bacterium]|nr:elongation factor G [Gemmatimonadota bacterium]
TPGHVDFTAEVERSLRVLDGAVAVFCAVGGVEPQSETVWRQADRYAVPRIAFVNKMDRIGADFMNVVDMMRDRLGANAHPVQYPLGEGELFTGMVDIIERKAIIFEDEMGSKVTEGPVPDGLTDTIEDLRNVLLEAAVEHDDELIEKYFAGEELTDEEFRRALRTATIKG